VDYLPRPLLQTIVRSAVEATGARLGWLAVVVDATELAVIAAAGEIDVVERVLWQRTAVGRGSASYVIQTGQPVALRPQEGGSSDDWAAEMLGRQPESIVCVPCHGEDQAIGALQLIDKVDGSSFSFDDIELAVVLAQIAGAAAAETTGGAVAVPSPAQLSSDLTRLADADPTRYVAVAQALSALVAQS